MGHEKGGVNIFEIPIGIKIIAGFFLLIGLCSICFAVLPWISSPAEGNEIERIFWMPLAPLIFFTIIASIGLLFKRRWSKYLVVSVSSFSALFLFLFFIGLLNNINPLDNVVMMIFTLLFICVFLFIIRYLLLNKKVKEVFNE